MLIDMLKYAKPVFQWVICSTTFDDKKPPMDTKTTVGHSYTQCIYMHSQVGLCWELMSAFSRQVAIYVGSTVWYGHLYIDVFCHLTQEFSPTNPTKCTGPGQVWTENTCKWLSSALFFFFKCHVNVQTVLPVLINSTSIVTYSRVKATHTASKPGFYLWRFWLFWWTGEKTRLVSVRLLLRPLMSHHLDGQCSTLV